MGFTIGAIEVTVIVDGGDFSLPAAGGLISGDGAGIPSCGPGVIILEYVG
jgi:hypothetical protein